MIDGAVTHGISVLSNSIFLNGPSDAGPGIALTNGSNAFTVDVFVNSSCSDPEGKQLVGTVETSVP